MKHAKKNPVAQVSGRIFAVLGVTLLAILLALYGAIAVVCHGPSGRARDLFVTTVMETSALKFLARMNFSDEEIADIRQRNAVIETDMQTDDTVLTPVSPDPETPPIVIEDVVGATYKGKMMIVKDPTRLFVGTPGPYDGRPGQTLDDLVKNNGAVAGINAGGFEDENGFGNGGTPIGIVIHDGELQFGSPSQSSTVIGFDGNGKLIVGNMTAQTALNKGIREAVSFGPALLVNGEAAPVAGTGGGLNPRTAIGQRADGAVLMLVIDGRQSHSLGASYKDCQEVMQQYGAINAANLDGGSSTLMIYEGEHVNYCASLYGSRDLPTSFLVRGDVE